MRWTVDPFRAAVWTASHAQHLAACGAQPTRYRAQAAERGAQAELLRCLFGPLPFRPIRISPAVLAWHDGMAVRLAENLYRDRAFDRLPILADALEEGGCDCTDLLGHLREPWRHCLGCWGLDAVLDKT